MSANNRIYDPVDYTPTVEHVASIIRARTKDNTGHELGTFTDNTRPTAEQVEEHIANAVIDIHTAVGIIGDPCVALATNAAAIGAAAEIELSYFPEQARADRSPYTYLKTRYDATLEGLAACVRGELPNTGTSLAGTTRVVSGAVYDYYTGRWWPVDAPEPPQPDPHLHRAR
jgi:hypothetical protein